MGYSIETYTYSGGPQTFNIPFALGYLSQSEITAQVVGEVDGLGDPINRAFTWNSATEILVTDPIAVGSQVRVARTVDKLNLEVDFLAAGTATKSALDRSARHVLMAVHEALDGRIGGQTRSVDDILSDIEDNAAAATASQTASAASATAAAGSASAASASATAAAGSATAAAASASAASTSQTTAAGSATAASGSASTATTQAANASASASAAATSATSANLAKVASEAARDATLAALDSFDDRYLGQKAANPTLDNGGGALVPGALYFNTTLDLMHVYTGTVWESISLSPSSVVQKTSATGSAIVPAGTTGERDGFPTAGYFRFNSTLGKFEGYTGAAWGSVGGGATGGGSDEVFFENGQTVTTNYTITNGKNAMSAGPITINSGVTVTIGSGEVWTIV